MNYRVIAYALNDWHGPWMNRQQLLSRLGPASPLIFSNGCWSVWETNELAWKSATLRGTFEETDHVFLDNPPRWLVQWPRLRRWSQLCVNAHTRRLKRFSKSLGAGPLVGYVFHPHFADYVQALRPDILVYHEYDLLARIPGWTTESSERRRALALSADLVIASSKVIESSLLDEGAINVLWLPNGADVDAFEAAAEQDDVPPDDLQAIPHPRIGYVGNLNRKVDLPLVTQLAARHQDWHFVFVGEVGNLDEQTRTALDTCYALPNVHFLGGKDHRALPAYVANMDVNTMLYRTDSAVWTEGIYPLKLHEYLAAGRPVVSAAIPSIMDYTDVVAVASGADAWSELIQQALSGESVGSVGERRETARANSWDIRAALLTQRLQKIVADKTQTT